MGTSIEESRASAAVVARAPAKPAAAASLVFAGAIGASAFLLFTLEPMVGRLVLPVFGGAPAVWATVLVFFQVLLLAGYLYAHLLATRVPPLRGAVVHVAVVALACLATWAVPRDVSMLYVPSLPVIPAVLWLLLVLVGPAAFAMTATTPLVSAWYARVRQAADPDAPSSDPYWLYALSNGGSLVSLLAYPLLIEPRLGLSAQRTWWGIGFAGLAALIALAALRLRAAHVAAPAAVEALADDAVAPAPTRRDRATWLVLAAIPAGLLSAVTNLVTTDLIAAPLLWVVPLAAYLGSFVIVFSARGRRLVPILTALAPATLTLLWLPMSTSAGWPILPLLVIEYVGLGIAAVAVHGRLAALRPHASHLTGFYLWMSAGGALGGAFVALVAPVLFKGVWEYPILVAGAVAVLAASAPAPAPGTRPIKALLHRAPWRILPYVAVVVPILALMAAESALGLQAAFRWALVGGLVLLFGGVPRFFVASTAVVLALATFILPPPSLFQDRSFFGVVQVTRSDTATTLFHGTTVHGQEWLDPARRDDPASYYARTGPVGDLFAAWATRPAGRIRVVGLGAGVIAVYARPDDDLAFFEIDPLVERVAGDPAFFSYLSGRSPRPTVKIGDGRLLMAQEPSHSVDFVIMDAFSSDTVPAHLLTLEALTDVDRALAANGILAVHVSNRYYDLEPPVAAALQQLGFTVLQRAYTPTPAEAAKGAGPSHFLMATRDPAVAALLAARGWTASREADGPLTDDFPDLFRFLYR
ncbi:MAG: hypothetical protein U0838_04625 [Chloroflexota bacterium]